jgi:hypothetical protein
VSDGIDFSSETIDGLRVVVHSHAWRDFFVPSLKSIRDSWLQSLVDGSAARQAQHSDDYIRGAIATLDAVLDLPEAVIAEADAEIARREAERAQDDHFVHRATLGTP